MRILRSFRRQWQSESPSLIVVANLVAMLLALASAPIIARSIGPEGRGVTASALAASAIVPILMSIGIPLEVRRLAAQGQGAAALRSARVFWLFAFIPAAAIGWLMDEAVFGKLQDGERALAFASIALCPLTISWITDTSLLVGLGRYRGVLALRLAQPLTLVLLISAGAVIGISSTSYVLAANLAGSALTAVLGAVLVRVPVRGRLVSRRALLKQGLTFSGSAAAESASNRLDQVLVLPLIGSAQSGYYSVAATVGALPLAVAQALAASFFRDIAAAPMANRRAMQSQAVAAASSISIVVCALIAAATPVLIPLVFGSSFSAAVPVTLVVLLGSVAAVIAYVSSLALAADSRGSRMTVAQTMALLLGITLLFVLAPHFGAVGAAIASSVSYASLLIMLLCGLGIGLRPLLPTRVGLKDAIRRLTR